MYLIVRALIFRYTRQDIDEDRETFFAGNISDKFSVTDGAIGNGPEQSH